MLTISYGDSETIICRKDGSIQQLNEITITGSKKNSSQIDIFNQQDLEKMEPFFKRYSDPGGVVSGSEVDHPSAAFIELNSGDQYITCTDGVGDAISIRNERFRSAKLDPEFLKDIMTLSRLKKLDGFQTAAFIAAISATCSKKRDDITISVRSISNN